MNTQEILARVDEQSKRIMTSTSALRSIPVTEMNYNQRCDYVYAQLDEWPVKLSTSEKEALFNVMMQSAEWAINSQLSSEELSERNKRIKQKRAERAAYEQELSKPHLQHVDVYL